MIPAPVLAERIAFVLRSASIHNEAGETARTAADIREAQDVLNELKKGLS